MKILLFLGSFVFLTGSAQAYTLCNSTDYWQVGYCEPGNTGPGLTYLVDYMTNPGANTGIHLARSRATFSKAETRKILDSKK